MFFLRPNKLQMARRVDAAEVAGHQPAVHDRFRGQSPDRRGSATSPSCCAPPLRRFPRRRVRRCEFPLPGSGRPTVSGAKRIEIVERDGGARLGQAVAVGDRNAEVVKKLQRLRLGERAAHKQSAQLAAKRLMDLLEQAGG